MMPDDPRRALVDDYVGIAARVRGPGIEVDVQPHVSTGDVSTSPMAW
jgi:hypothetical protein